MAIPGLGENWKTTLGGLMIAVGTGLQYAGQGEIGAILVGVGGILLGKAAPDKEVTKQAIQDVRQGVAENTAHIEAVKEVARVQQPLMPPPYYPPLDKHGRRD